MLNLQIARIALPAVLLAAAAVGSAPAQPVVTGEDSAAAAARHRAHDAQERLQGDIALLQSILEAQRELIAWNRIRAQTGLAPLTLDAGLCRQLPGWCAALPGAFGPEAGSGDSR